MKHYGIWFIDVKQWLIDDSGMVFHTTSKAVAQAQREMSIAGFIANKVIIKEFK